MYLFMRFIRIALVILVVYFLFKVLFRGEGSGFFKKKRQPPHPRKQIREMKKDPVCGTYIPEDQAFRYKDEYFCSEECKEKFRTLQNSG